MRMTMLAALAGLLAGPGLALAQDSQAIETEMFSQLNAGGQFNLVATLGEAHTVTLDGDAADFEKLDIDVVRGELVIRQDRRWWSDNETLDITVRVTAPRLRAVDFHRGVSAEVDGIDAGSFDVVVNTGALVRLRGTCEDMSLELNTGGALNARDLVCERVDVEASTGGSGSIHATERARIEARMGAEVDVYGKPSRHDFQVFLGAEIDVH